MFLLLFISLDVCIWLLRNTDQPHSDTVWVKCMRFLHLYHPSFQWLPNIEEDIATTSKLFESSRRTFQSQICPSPLIDTVVYWRIISVIIHCTVCLLISCKEPTANFRNQCNLQISYLLADCSDYIIDTRDLIIDYQCNMSI